MAPAEGLEVLSDSGGEGGDAAAADADAPTTPRRVRRQSFIRGGAEGEGDRHLLKYKASHEKREGLKDLISAGLKGNRFCSRLEGEQVEAIVEALEYFAFHDGDVIVRQGETGNYFFVVDEGTCEVSVNGSVTNTLSHGVAFGAIALIYNCPRTATVTARARCGIWGVSGKVFRRVLQEHARAHHAENRQFLDRFSLFDGLSAKQKGLISELALMVERFCKGSRVITEGEAPTAMYFVKRGELSRVQGGKVDASGALSGGEHVSHLSPGHCFGERSALYNEPHRATVIADGDCELVCISVGELKEVLGGDLATCLQQSFVLSVLKTLPVVSHLSCSQHQQIAQAMEVKSYDPGQKLGSDLRLVIVLEGEVSSPEQQPLRRGQWSQDTDLAKLQEESGNAGGVGSQLGNLAAGPAGARAAVLTRTNLAGALRNLGLSALGAGEEGVIDYMRKVLLARKVPIFSRLSKEQVDNVASCLVLRRYTQGAQVFRKGEAGSAFFVVAAGELSVLVGSDRVRALQQGTCFGERALLFDEPRSATVEVVSETAELWSLDRRAFQEVVTEPMRSELVQRVVLQNTDITLKSLRHVRLIGAGAFGSVRLVEHRRSGQRYALKRCRKLDDGRAPEEVAREWQLLTELDHPCVLRMVRSFETDSSLYILMELITGGQLCEEVHDRMGLLSRKQAQFYIASLVIILEFLHEHNVVYRDLKPENVMLDIHGYLKLVDLGLAKKLGANEPRTYTLAGTPYYMAPETILGNGYGLEVDNWSLGVMMYEFVSGVLPFGPRADTKEEVLGAILDDELKFIPRYNDQAGKKLIQGLLCKDPRTRLGAGISGWEEVKSAKFFKAGVSGDLFSQIMERTAVPPVIPDTEQYTKERMLNDYVTLSDSEELGPQSDGTDRVVSTFKLFDINGDGKISRHELSRVLQRLDPVTFTEAAVGQLLDAADTNGDEHISFEEFVGWISSSAAEPLRRTIDADLVGKGRL